MCVLSEISINSHCTRGCFNTPSSALPPVVVWAVAAVSAAATACEAETSFLCSVRAAEAENVCCQRALSWDPAALPSIKPSLQRRPLIVYILGNCS